MMPNLNSFAEWLSSVLLYIPQKIWQMFVDSLLPFIDSIFAACTQCNFSQISSLLSGLPSSITFTLGWFNFSQGLSIVCCAYLIRFLIRRIPFIG